MDGFIFLYVAGLFLAGLLITRLMKLVRLPNVTGYIITGIIMGPFVFGLFFNGFDFLNANNAEISPIYRYVSSLSWVNNVALGFIAFSIGSSFKLSALKKVGKRVILITIFESLFASIAVLLALLAFHFAFPETIPFPLVLTMAAIAAATAPAATLMVIKQYKAKGPVVDTLLPVVALDDASALILFAVLFQIAKTVALGGAFSVYEMLAKPFIEILISVGLGAIFGFLISFCCRYFKSRANRLTFVIFIIFSAVGLYYLFKLPELGSFELSSLLTCMVAGAIYCNMREDSSIVFSFMDRFTSPIYMLFFVLSGASLDLTIFASKNGLLILLTALIYALSRVIGKWFGAFFGAEIGKAEPQVKKYLGFCLVPQAGVAIGLATTAGSVLSSSGSSIGALIVAITLTSTLIYELTGPFITKAALTKAGEIAREA